MPAPGTPPATPDFRGARYAPISDYALISDCHGSALVSRTGSIDWACPRRFDSGSIFGRLLDAERGGYCAITPTGRFAVDRLYLDDTLVLGTRFETPTGEIQLTDAMAMREGGRTQPLRQLIRVLEGIRGTVECEIVVEPRFDYGSLRPWLHRHDPQGTFSAVGGDEAIVLSTDFPLSLDSEAVAFRGTITVAAGERYFLSLVWFPAYAVAVEGVSGAEVDARLAATLDWWRRWTAHGRYDGPYRQMVQRSALVLKALTTAPTGAIVAAPTTSLPERIGGSRNWDYRYCWVRDSAFTIAALYAVGHQEVAQGFRRFLARAAAGQATDMQILYGCYGERRIPEIELSHLEGYRGSRPVRVGNAAADQRQLDVYGELINAFWASHRAGDRIGDDSWHFVESLVNAAASAWREPDRGVWEIRGEPRHFVYSKAMCWVALDRGLRLAADVGHPGDLSTWATTRDEIRAAIFAHGIDPERGCFVQAYGSTALDASLLTLAHVGFVDANDPVMLATVAAIERELVVDGLVLRYRPARTDDGVGGTEGAFLMCSFWLADVLAMQGRLEEATRLFERLAGLANDVGLFAEECDPRTGALLGNFPQAFTHVALINSARALMEAHEEARPPAHTLSDASPADTTPAGASSPGSSPAEAAPIATAGKSDSQIVR